ncbi:MAG: hypothetical protein M1823_004646 [Watsoniomyces obsoletus]|nr:MAG: hypothetical protein M1823_004646 [Watsoniomyces obsoletus]
MEEQLLTLLADTQSTAAGPRKQAEQQLVQLYSNPAFPVSLCAIASHQSVPVNLRQSALLVLKAWVLSGWSPAIDEYGGEILANEATKDQVREALLRIATGDEEERKVRSAASYVVSKIASSDFPDQWPTLLPTLLHLIPTGTPTQSHGALKVLGDLVDDGLSDDQFFGVAADLIKVVYDAAMDDSKKSTLRALAVSVFRSSFGTLDMIKDSHREAVKAFADEALKAWMPYFVEMIKRPLPPAPREEDEANNGGPEEEWRGLIALKIQIVKTLMKIRDVFPALLSPQSPLLFSTVWQELTSLQGAYHQLYINDERQGSLVDADGLPYTLDFLAQEELDFIQACLRAPPVRAYLNAGLQSQPTAAGGPPQWLLEMMKLAVAYGQITTEEEGLWEIDVNLFLSEETSVTANCTARIACGDLLITLGTWLKMRVAEQLLVYAETVFSSGQSTWKEKEAVLYLFNQLLGDFYEVDKTISDELANRVAEYVRYGMQQADTFLRARAYLVGGKLIKASGPGLHPVGASLMQQTLKTLTEDTSEVVRVACIRVLQDYLQALPSELNQSLQTTVIDALSHYFSALDPNELTESDELMVALAVTLRDAIALNTSICVASNSNALSLLFTIGSRAANNFQLTELVNETFEKIAGNIADTGTEGYARLCEIVLPSLTGAFDVGEMTGEGALSNLAIDLLATLADKGTKPLPPGFVAAVMPKLNRLLLSANEARLLRPGTEAVKDMLLHDPEQLFSWHDEAGKSGLEICLMIIDRLLQHGMNDNAVAEVGGLAAELVEKAGSERLGPYLFQLLQAVAIRLASAEEAAFIQSLILVFTRLSLISAKDVVDFLAQVQVGHGQENGLQVVMSKWLENSVIFSGYDEIRQK